MGGGIRGLIVDDAKDCFVLLRRPRNDGDVIRGGVARPSNRGYPRPTVSHL